jgi:transposase
MRNVVSKFIGKSEKEVNEDLVKMSAYYGFAINVTNSFKANEKGHVEKSVDAVRNQIFAETWAFNSIEDDALLSEAQREYANSRPAVKAE